MIADVAGKGFAHFRREVMFQRGGEMGIVGQVAGHHLVKEHDLGIGQQDTDFRPRQRLARLIAFAQHLIAGQGFDLAVQMPLFLKPGHQPAQRCAIGRPPHFGQRQGQRLLIIVAQHQIRHLVRHRGQKPVAFRTRQAAVMHRRCQRDLDVHLNVRGIHPGRVVDGVRIAAPAIQAEFDPPLLRDAKVRTLADDAGASLACGDADRVIGAVADLLGIGAAFHYGLADEGGVFHAWVVIGYHHHIGKLGSDGPHDRAFTGITVAAAAKYSDQAFFGMGA